MNSTNLTLPFLAPAQAQKHVTVNEALLRLDAIVQMRVRSAAVAEQPAAPVDGHLWILPPGKTGSAWSGFAEGALAYYRDGAWEEITPRQGWLCFVEDSGAFRCFANGAWVGLSPASVSLAQGDRQRAAAGTGPAEEIACTAAGRALLAAAGSGAQRSLLGAAAADNVVTLTGAQTVSGPKTFADAVTVSNIFGQNAASAYTIAAEPVGGFFNGGYIQLYGSASGAGALVLLCAGPGASFGVSPAGPSFNGARVYHAGADPTPDADGARNLGAAALRFHTLYAGTGAINTSDAREKTPVRPLTEKERRAARRAIAAMGVYQWRSSVEAKGEGARLHVGATAQAVAEAFEAEGLDPGRYGLWCADETTGGDRRLGLRVDQLFALALAALAAGEASPLAE